MKMTAMKHITAVLPVKESKLILSSAAIACPTSAPPVTKAQMEPGRLFSLRTRSKILVTATLVKFVVGAPFLMGICESELYSLPRVHLPDNRIAANKTKGTVPTINSNWKVESRNDSDNSEWVPLFHHKVTGS
jgi:hypothetical protein